VLDRLKSIVTALTTTGTRVATTIAVGGTAQNLFGSTPANGFEIYNPSQTEALFILENGTATAAYNAGNIAIPPLGAYATPPGYKPTGDVSVIAATTGHGVIGRRW
jgi:hypothetical protein